MSYPVWHTTHSKGSRQDECAGMRIPVHLQLLQVTRSMEVHLFSEAHTGPTSARGCTCSSARPAILRHCLCPVHMITPVTWHMATRSSRQMMTKASMRPSSAPAHSVLVPGSFVKSHQVKASMTGTSCCCAMLQLFAIGCATRIRSCRCIML